MGAQDEVKGINMVEDLTYLATIAEMEQDLSNGLEFELRQALENLRFEREAREGLGRDVELLRLRVGIAEGDLGIASARLDAVRTYIRSLDLESPNSHLGHILSIVEDR